MPAIRSPHLGHVLAKSAQAPARHNRVGHRDGAGGIREPAMAPLAPRSYLNKGYPPLASSGFILYTLYKGYPPLAASGSSWAFASVSLGALQQYKV